MNDMKHAQPHQRGEQNPHAKLTARKVMEIRRALASPDSRKRGSGIVAIGRKYGVSHTAVWMIRKRRTWRYTDGA